MFTPFSTRFKRFYSFFSLFSLLFQNIAPLFFLAPLAFAQTSLDIGLSFEKGEHQLVFSGSIPDSAEYIIHYDDADESTPGDEISGQVSGQFEKKIFIGTCSEGDCVKDEITKGSIELPAKGYFANFTLKDEVLWLNKDNTSTVKKVELNKKYVSPQNDQVSVTFTKLPENPGSLHIEEITLSDEQVAQFGAASKLAYDITSDMTNGSFEYDLVLPLPEKSETTEPAQVVYAETVDQLSNPSEIENEKIHNNQVVSTGLDHFTVFIVVYDSKPIVVPGSFPSLGFAATSTSEFGDHLILASSERDIAQINVGLTNWACENDFVKDGNGVWVQQRGNTEACVTTPGSSYTHPITLNIYEVDTSGAVPQAGSLITTKTIDATIPFRPSWDARCADPTTDSPFGGTWYDESTSSCVHGYAFDVEYDFTGLTLPDEFVIGVAYNTSHHGYSPIGVAGPYNSLNMSLHSEAPSVGTNVNADDVFWNTSHAAFYSDSGAAGVGTFRQDTLWSGYVPVFEIYANEEDTTGPEAPEIIYPAENQYLNTSPILNNWSDVTDESGIQKYRVQYEYDDGHTFSGFPYRETTVSQRNHQPAINEQGGVKFRVQAFDNANNEGAWSEWRHYYYDATAPAAPVLTSPANGALVTGNPQQQWTAVADAHHYEYESYADAGLTSSIYNTTVTGSSRTVGGNQTITFWWRVRAVDAAGNKSAWSNVWQLNIDNTAPVAPTLLTPLNNSVVNGTLLTNDWSDVGDAHHYIYESYNNSSATQLRWHEEFTQSQKSATNVADTTFWWRVKTVDAAGNQSPWSNLWKVTVDNTKPTTTLTSPSASLITNDPITISGTSTDNNGIKEVNLYYSVAGQNNWQLITSLVNSGTATPFNFTYNWVPNSEGVFDIKASGTDLAGNVEQSAYVYGVTFDQTSPDVNITQPAAGIVSGTVAVRGTVTDTNPHHYWFVIQNSTGGTVAGPGTVNDNTSFTDKLLLTWDTTGVADGTYKIKLEARDSADNKDSGSSHWVTVTVDNTKPSSIISTFELENGGETQTSEFSGLIEGTASDNLSGIDHVLLSISHLAFGADESSRLFWDDTSSSWVTTESSFRAQGTTNWSYQLTDTPEGFYQVISHAVDMAGNIESTYTINIVYDKTIPEVNLAINPTSPDGDNGWYRYTKPTITLTAGDNYQLEKIEYQWDSTAGIWVTYTGSFSPESEGKHILYYRSVDTIGNFSSLGIKEVKYDTSRPAGEPLNLKVENIGDKTADASWEAPKPADGVSFYRLTWKHTDGTVHGVDTGSDDFKHQLTDLYNGVWTFTVKAMDEAGNFTEKSTEFRVGPGPAVVGGTGAVLGTNTETPLGGGLTTFNQPDLGDEEVTELKEENPSDSPENVSEGKVLGATDSCSGWENYLPALFLFTQLLLIVGYEFSQREPSISKLVVAGIITLTAMGLYSWIKKDACFADGTLMNILNYWFVGVSLLTGFVGRLFGKFLLED